MTRTADQLREDAVAIWRAGLDAVRSDRLIHEALQCRGDQLVVGETTVELGQVCRLVVIGAGKAGAGMAAAVEEVLAPVAARLALQGWVNVPADCTQSLRWITLHPARPAGLNEPTADGVFGSQRIEELTASLGPEDLCLVLLSGGASALLPAPVSGVSLADKQALTRFLSGAGANIQQLNTVRKQLSRLKGGRLADACRAGRLLTLIISDVLGDPLDVIGSGPTVPDRGTPREALQVLEDFGACTADVAPTAIKYLQEGVRSGATPIFAAIDPDDSRCWTNRHGCRISNHVIGNNALAVDAAGIEAERRGYSAALIAATRLEGEAEEIGRELARQALLLREEPGPDCLISGGEPVVRLAPAATRGRGGRNQQLVLAAALELQSSASAGICLLSGGTDGEDGPTDAAGALVDAQIVAAIEQQGLDAADALRRNDAYPLFAAVDGLLRTGPTHTNVCDLRVAVVDRVTGVH